MEISNMRGLLLGCIVRTFTQKEYEIRVDWLPAVPTDEVGRLFSKYGNVINVYKELAPRCRDVRDKGWLGDGENLVDGSQSGPLNQMFQDSQGTMEVRVWVRQRKRKRWGTRWRKGFQGRWEGCQWRGSCQRRGHRVGKVGERVLRMKRGVGNKSGKGVGKAK